MPMNSYIKTEYLILMAKFNFMKSIIIVIYKKCENNGSLLMANSINLFFLKYIYILFRKEQFTFEILAFSKISRCSQW